MLYSDGDTRIKNVAMTVPHCAVLLLVTIDTVSQERSVSCIASLYMLHMGRCGPYLPKAIAGT